MICHRCCSRYQKVLVILCLVQYLLVRGRSYLVANKYVNYEGRTMGGILFVPNHNPIRMGTFNYSKRYKTGFG